MRGPLVALVIAVSQLCAHDLAGDVKVQAYMKPQGQTMHVVLRAPLQALGQDAAATLVEVLEIYEDGSRVAKPTVVAMKTSLATDKSFVAYRDAVEHIASASPAPTGVPLEQLVFDVALDYPIRSQVSEFSIRPNLARLGASVVTVLWFLPPEGTVRAFEYTGDAGLVRLDPRWWHAALTFVRLGFFHILDGTDHLLFLACLVIPLRRIRQLLVIVTAFTVAHSITLVASAFGLAPNAAWFPPVVELLIAASIVYMAVENMLGGAMHRRWAITFAFGLIHGFGFSFALHETLQFAGAHLVTSLLAFNVGVELGQVLVLIVLVPVLALLVRYSTWLSAPVALVGLYWMWERASVLATQGFQ